ncbi:hypothetical protein [Salinibacter altiplanensis]|uniref:hypothetical protein n=1 Tax=Salinibacter altiplanensis TaxID=1803181 RepID=UPI001319E987|nr:hypothetical protein [Salinibacter altiplanensis]
MSIGYWIQRPRLFLLIPFLTVFGGLSSPLHAQAPSPTPDTGPESLDRSVRVYLDCSRCYTSYMRRNVTFVDYVRDPEQADVHLLGTRRGTGGGGVSHRLEFIGHGPFEGTTYQMNYEAAPTLTREERRRGLANRLRLGLISFANRTPDADHVSVSYNPPDDASAKSSSEDAPWNQWVFDVGVSGSADLQEQEHAYELRGKVSAERVTSAWKVDLGLGGEQEVDVFERSDTTDIRSVLEDYDFDADVIKTLGPQSGMGLSGTVFSRTFTNIYVGTRLRAAAEYNLFPYDISDQKQLTVQYRMGPEYRNYRSVTIFDRERETLVRQSLRIGLRLNRTWGSVSTRLETANYLHDFSRNSVEFGSNVDVKLTEGLSLQFRFNAERIQDQLSLPAGDPSDEDVLLSRRERATTYEFGGAIGLSYTFGSIYNSVVNTRL